MAREATSELCIKPKTKELCKEAKPDGVTWDHWIRENALGVE